MTQSTPVGLLLLCYFACYMPYSLTLKVLGEPLATLPTSVLGASLAWCAYLALSGHWRSVGVRDSRAWIAGAGGALILTSSTLAYSLPSVSLVLPKLVMGFGVILLAPLLDARNGAALTRRQTTVLCLAALAVACSVWRRTALDATASVLCCATAYVSGYALKLRAIDGRRGDWGFFTAETSLTLALALPASLLACAWFGAAPSARPLALLSGVFSQGCGCFGGLVLLRFVSARVAAHSLLVPLHRSTGLLATVAASLALAAWRLGPRAALSTLSPGELCGAALMGAALWVGSRR